jgi:hypothetical protein
MGGQKCGQAHQGPIGTQNCNTNKRLVLGVVLECGKAKFMVNIVVYALDGIKTILRNTF